MAVVKPFMCIRPAADKAARVAALPYDVYNRKEACEAVKGNPLSFLNIDRAETQFGDDVDTYDSRVYDKARELLDCQIEEGVYVTDPEENYYLYELTMDGRSQTGIVACCSIDDYVDGVVKKHENTREDKELDRIRHVDTANAHTGPIFLAYRQNQELKALVAQVKEEALKRREENPDYTGKEPFNYFLSVLFPDEELKILPYNRVVKDLNGLGQEDFLAAVSERFEVQERGGAGTGAFGPEEKGTFGMFLKDRWYSLKVKPEFVSSDPVKGLDVSILQDQLLGPVLGIGDPRVDKRVDFIGGIRGLKELERRVGEDMEVAFSMFPTSIEELLSVADAGLLMPPKSTWFEPKLRSGLFIHRLG